MDLIMISQPGYFERYGRLQNHRRLVVSVAVPCYSLGKAFISLLVALGKKVVNSASSYPALWMPKRLLAGALKFIELVCTW
jgi:hypothetical protein